MMISMLEYYSDVGIELFVVLEVVTGTDIL